MQLKHTQKNPCAVCGEGAVTDRTCPQWFAKFHAGDFSLDNAPQSSRPVEVETDRLLRTINSTMWEIADILNIS